jgi:gp6-like head-tail connector protein
MYGDLATLKAALGITDTTRDTALTLALNAASEQIDTLTGRTFNASTTSATTRVYRTTAHVDGTALLVDPIGDVTGLAVGSGATSTGTFTALPAATYDVGPDNAIVKGQPVTMIYNLSYAWTIYPYVQVTARFGWPATPYAITQAALLQAGRLYRRKDSPEGVVGSAEFGGITTVRRVDPDVMQLISPFSLPGFA